MADCGFSDGEPRQSVPFCHTQDVGYGRSIFVTGSSEDLGSWTPTGAVKLRWTSGNIWTGQIAVRAGETFEYKYIHRSTAADQICESTNVVLISLENLTNTAMSIGPAPYDGKTIYYYSNWTQAVLLASTDGISFVDWPMDLFAPGRVAGEFLYRVTGVGSPGGSLEFVLHNGEGEWDNSQNTWDGEYNYFTRLDAFVLQDKQIYNYWPAASESPPRIVTNWIDSTAPDNRVSGRVARIYLPRGYAEHTNRQYPVMYFHDGQNVFEHSRSGASSTDSWQVDLMATREIQEGRMRECILVGLDNTGSRQYEYNVPGDAYPGQPEGIGDSYLYFLMNNVRPALEANYRVLTDRRNTLVGGSSMGGLISIYCGMETNVYGGVLAMSPSLTRATNYTAALWSKVKRDVCIYIDTGSGEGQVGPTPGGDYWEKPQEGYDIFLNQGHVVNEDLLWRVGCGAVHNELAWRARTPGALAFLLDVRDEPSQLLAGEVPPQLAGSASAAVSATVLRQQAVRFEQSVSMTDPAWQPLATSAVERLPWGTASFTNHTSNGTAFLRAVAVSEP